MKSLKKKKTTTDSLITQKMLDKNCVTVSARCVSDFINYHLASGYKSTALVTSVATFSSRAQSVHIRYRTHS